MTSMLVDEVIWTHPNILSTEVAKNHESEINQNEKKKHSLIKILNFVY